MFRTIARVRDSRALHPVGLGFEAVLRPDPAGATGADLFDGPPRPAVVRISRAVGLPEPLPEPFGLAIRVPGAYGAGRHQDVLLTTAAPPPLARHLPLPVPGVMSGLYSTLLPFSVGGRKVLMAARPDGDLVGGGGLQLSDLSTRAEAGLTFGIELGTRLGAWSRVATLNVGAPLSREETAELRFAPENTGGGIEPAGLLNRLRPQAYRGSREGWA